LAFFDLGQKESIVPVDDAQKAIVAFASGSLGQQQARYGG